jgi:hypothetical protein
MNVRKKPLSAETVAARNSKLRVLVDGVEVKLVWYFDTCAGVVKSYDVCGNGKMLLKHDAKYDFGGYPRTNLELLDDEIWSKTVLGAVTLEDTIFSPATTRQSLHRSNPGPSSPARLGDRAT